MSDYQFNPNVEQWKDIVGFPGYEVSDHGQVRSFWKRGHSAFFLQATPQKILAAPTNIRGYPAVNLCREGKVVKKAVHALVLETFVGPCPPGMEGCHEDGIKTRNHLTNLRWDTKSANSLDSIRHGTHAGLKRKGIKHPLAKLSEAMVKNIREMSQIGITQGVIGKKFGISQSQVSHIVCRHHWNHVP